jgi:hypothetical protein
MPPSPSLAVGAGLSRDFHFERGKKAAPATIQAESGLGISDPPPMNATEFSRLDWHQAIDLAGADDFRPGIQSLNSQPHALNGTDTTECRDHGQ